MIFIWSTALVIGILVFVHELGHYLAARSVGVRVEKFSIGFPPRFFTVTSVDGGFDITFFFFRFEQLKRKSITDERHKRKLLFYVPTN